MAGLDMIPASSAASRCSPCSLKNVLRKETERHRKDEEYEKSIVAVPFDTPPQWGAVVSIVSALLVAGKAGEGCLRQRESSAACARFLVPATTGRLAYPYSHLISRSTITLRVCRMLGCKIAMAMGTRPILNLKARIHDSRYCT